jgi:hypothetical protein
LNFASVRLPPRPCEATSAFLGTAPWTPPGTDGDLSLTLDFLRAGNFAATAPAPVATAYDGP